MQEAIPEFMNIIFTQTKERFFVFITMLRNFPMAFIRYLSIGVTLREFRSTWVDFIVVPLIMSPYISSNPYIGLPVYFTSRFH